LGFEGGKDIGGERRYDGRKERREMLKDRVFFRMGRVWTPQEVSQSVGGELRASEGRSLELKGFSWCEKAGDHDIIFIDNKKYLSAFYESRAACVLLSERLWQYVDRDVSHIHVILCENARLAFAEIMRKSYESVYGLNEGVSAHACVAEGVGLGEGVRVGPYAVIEEGAVIGSGTRIGSHAVVGSGVVLGEGCELGAHASVECTVMGDRVKVGSGSRVGTPGFGMVETEDGFVDIFHTGRVVIGSDVVIGSNVCIDRGTLEDTVIEDGCRLGDFVLVSHNVRLGRHCALAGQVGTAGSAILGDRVFCGGQSGIGEHVKLGNGVRVLGQSGVIEDIADGSIMAGTPAMPVKAFFKLVQMMKQFGGGR
jgi:UDP-3-O-[3-hydroxymyristoyl] glucosamine N-acyltransferase